jgi:hypothetical protein
MKILIISSCTGDKDAHGFPSILSRPEVDKLRLSGLLKSRSEKGRAARALYTGQQHKQLFVGVDMLREQYGTAFCTVKIISAAYGLVSEMQPLLPYEATFKERGINPTSRGRDLQVSSSIQRSLKGFSLVFFLLGKEYLKSIHSPIIPIEHQKLIFFAPPGASLPASRHILVPIIAKGSGNISAKGRAFRWLATGMCRASTDPESLMSNTAEKLKLLIEQGNQV